MSSRISACVLLLLAFPSFASAVPIVAGFGDSITCTTCNDSSYLRLLGDFLDPDPIIDDNGVSANRTGGVLSRLDAWIADGNTADVLILITGTPDTTQAVGGFHDREFSETETLGKIADMIDLVLGSTSIPLILAAPPPAVEPCASPKNLTCSIVDTRLGDLAAALAPLAASKSVPFLDLYQAFMDDLAWQADPDSFYVDGLHPRIDTGDTLIASLLAPMIQTLVLIPEPSSALLLLGGLAGLAAAGRRRPVHARSDC